MKTIDEIQQEVAKECGEKSFDVLVEAEMSVGDYATAMKLLSEVWKRYFAQFNLPNENSVRITE